MQKLMIIPKAMIAIFVIVCVNPLPLMADWVTTLEHTELWAGGTAVTLSSVTTSDLNGDGSVEIITIGTTEVSEVFHAELRVLNWDGSEFSQLAEELWQIDDQNTFGREVYCGDINGDGTLEILTAAIGDQLELRVWHFDLDLGSLVSETEGIWDTSGFSSMAVGDVDGDGQIEIITGERGISPDGYQIRIVRFEGDGFVEEHIETWEVGGSVGIVDALAVGDVDADGMAEIVTAVTASERIEVRVWRWNGSSMNLEVSDEWSTMDQTDVADVSIGNLNVDSYLEIVVVGTASDFSVTDHPFFGCVSVWEWDGTDLQLLTYQTWQSTLGMVEFFDCHVIDIDSSGIDEIVVAGPLHETPAQNVMRVYNLDDWTLEAMFSEEWIAEGMTSCFTYAVTAADVDGDDRVEIITCGRGVDASGQSQHEMDIWSAWFQVRPLGWLDWLKVVFSFERWPFYQALRDSIPMPWPNVIYACIFVGVVVFALFGVRRLFSIIRKPESRKPISRKR